MSPPGGQTHTASDVSGPKSCVIYNRACLVGAAIIHVGDHCYSHMCGLPDPKPGEGSAAHLAPLPSAAASRFPFL